MDHTTAKLGVSGVYMLGLDGGWAGGWGVSGVGWGVGIGCTVKPFLVTYFLISQALHAVIHF